jgi:hypothetical protein
MDEIPCMDVLVEELGLSQQCLDNIRKTGIETIGELIEAIARSSDAFDGLSLPIARCFHEIFKQLKRKGCWLDSLDEYLKWID